MSKRFDNRKLLYILAGLAVLLLFTVVYRMPRQKSTLRETLVNADTAEVARIVMFPRTGSGRPFEFIREGNKWTLKQEDITARPSDGAVENILSEILAIKPQSLAGKGESKLKEFELTDSLATRIKLLNKKGKVLADLMTGGFTYRQVRNPYGGGYGGNNIEGISYVRLYGEDEIYAVDGFLSLSFRGEFNDWRDKTFIKFKKEDVTRISFSMPADTSYTLALKDSVWYVNDEPADSASTAGYLNSVSFINGQNFRDHYKPDSSPVYQAIIEGNNLLNLTVKCYRDTEAGKFILNSSLNPDVYFESDFDDLVGRVFKSRKYFRK